MPSEFVDEKLPGEILSKLASFREFGTFCDVILEADSSSKAKSEPTSPTSIRAHKLVLAAASPYFSKTERTHRAKVVQEWCRNNLSDFIASNDWPPNSPDLNPLEYSIWAVLEKNA
ncbi:unnamed protein product [Nippostrongylus brasiliensis]|uniref:BTB domain-containing protein n=1 Tax=Nippostrongylus brasiliensis TaxID=27835 RepID=A0A0N4YQU5_NIPBR|nr:unnamed protein product [Nippostrongylus brasiliensis]